MNVNDTFRKRYNIPVLLLSREDNLWWCLSFKEMLRQSCTERGESSVQEAGEDGYGSGQVWFQESCGSMVQSQLQPPRSKWSAWRKCLSVCVSVCVQIYMQISLPFFSFFLGGEGWEHMILKERGHIATTGACGGHKLRTDLQCISWRHLKQNSHLKFPSLKKDKG